MTRTSNLFLALLISLTVVTLIYTALAMQRDGVNFIAIALQNLSSLNWSGQFTLDFGAYLLLSSLWILWRAKFSPSAYLPAAFAMILGIIFFAPYLVFLWRKSNGNVSQLLLGKQV